MSSVNSSVIQEQRARKAALSSLLVLLSIGMIFSFTALLQP